MAKPHWSKELVALTREAFETREFLPLYPNLSQGLPPSERAGLGLKNIADGHGSDFGYVNYKDIQAGALIVRSCEDATAIVQFKDIDELIAAGWALD